MSILAALAAPRKLVPLTLDTENGRLVVCLRPVTHGIISGFSAHIQGKEKDPEAQAQASGYLLHALVVDPDGTPVFESAAHACTVLAGAPIDSPMGELQRKVMVHITVAGSAATPKASPPTTDSVG